MVFGRKPCLLRYIYKCKKIRMKRYALVTGASGGIGEAISYELARKGWSLLLVARSEDKLALIANDLQEKYSVDAQFLSLDLTKIDAVDRLINWVEENHWSVAVLVNNAGYGLWGSFENLTWQEQENMLQLNVHILTALTHRFLPLLKQHLPAYILNVASTAAYQAVPSLSLYAATKAFVLIFSRSLRVELKKENIHVSCLSPGPVATGFINRAGMQAIAEKAAKFEMSPAVVAKIAVAGLFQQKAEIIPGFTNKITAILGRFLPKSLVEAISSRLYKK